MPILRDGYATTNFTYLRTEFSQTLIFSNSCINPVIYCWRLVEICAAVKTHCRNSYVANDHVLRKVGAQNWQLPLGEKRSCILARKHYFNPQLKHCLHNRRQLISTASSVSDQLPKNFRLQEIGKDIARPDAPFFLSLCASTQPV